MTVYDPFNWLPSAYAKLETYIKDEIDKAVVRDGNVPIGSQVYDVVMDSPEAVELPKPAEFTKTIIHFGIDDIENRRLGLGTNKIESVYDEAAQTVYEIEAKWHELNFDVGVWASDQSGGSSSRLRAYKVLHQILGTEIGKRRCQAQTGVEIRTFIGGRFIIERPNDVRLYRIIGAELVVRLHSQLADAPDVIVGEVVQEPDLEIASEPLID